MKKNRIYLLLLLLPLCLSFIFLGQRIKTVKADELSDSIENQLENIDLEELEDYFNNLGVNGSVGIIDRINDMLSGKFEFEYTDFFNYLLNSVFSEFLSFMPVFILVIVIAVFLGILKSIKGVFLQESILEVIYFACISGIIILIFSQVFIIVSSVKNAIENLSKLNEIISPIIITLIVASGGSSVANTIKPASVFLSGGVVQIINSVIMPLVSVMLVFTVLSNLSTGIKLKNTCDFIAGIIKWIIGIIISVFGIFTVVQGVGGAFYDGISVKAAKYILSNSVPIIGGFLKDGFDVIIAGSVLIKNSIGIVGVFLIFYTVLSPIMLIASFLLVLKFSAAVIEPLSDNKISDFCLSVGRCVNYLLVALLMVSVMLFINILMMIFSANSLIL